MRLRYHILKDWLFYLLLIGYGYLIFNMTYGLWFGGGVNIFASYSDAATVAEITADANKVYWAKTCFLFGTFLLVALNFDFRTAAGMGAIFWSGSLIIMFGATPVLLVVAALGILLTGQQIRRGQTFTARGSD